MRSLTKMMRHLSKAHTHKSHKDNNTFLKAKYLNGNGYNIGNNSIQQVKLRMLTHRKPGLQFGIRGYRDTILWQAPA